MKLAELVLGVALAIILGVLVISALAKIVFLVLLATGGGLVAIGVYFGWKMRGK